jgi:hypothetical protein
MNLLLDTHAWLWFVLGDPQLSSNAKNHILDPANATFVSPASYWEVSIKISLGKYVLAAPYQQFMQRATVWKWLQSPPHHHRPHGARQHFALPSSGPVRPAVNRPSGGGGNDPRQRRPGVCAVRSPGCLVTLISRFFLSCGRRGSVSLGSSGVPFPGACVSCFAAVAPPADRNRF